MSKCNGTKDLEVHHKNRGLTVSQGLNLVGNAEVLCSKCHDNVVRRLGKPNGIPNFSQAVKDQALKRANFKCECERNNCH